MSFLVLFYVGILLMYIFGYERGMVFGEIWIKYFGRYF